MSDTPELDKISANRGDSQTIGEFLEWATTEGGFNFTKTFESGEMNLFGEKLTNDVPVRIEDALADFFGIDLKKAEEERRALLADAVAANEEHRGTYTVYPAPEDNA